MPSDGSRHPRLETALLVDGLNARVGGPSCPKCGAELRVHAPRDALPEAWCEKRHRFALTGYTVDWTESPEVKVGVVELALGTELP